MTSSAIQSTMTLPAATSIGTVRLRVSDQTRSLAFYEGVLGFGVARSEGQTVYLTAGEGEPLVELRAVPGLARAPRNSAGLYHFAVLLPSRQDLARFVKQLVAHTVPFGQSDHSVSEAIYFDDPDGNGIEVYADRPRETWSVDDGIVHFTGDPINFDDLFATLDDDDPGWTAMPQGTRIGHVHLRVSDLQRSFDFYRRLGFELTADYVRGARFVSAGGYHHHLGMNIWESSGRSIAGSDVAGLDSFTIVVPNRDSLRAAASRLGIDLPNGSEFRAHDPDGIEFTVAVTG